MTTERTATLDGLDTRCDLAAARVHASEKPRAEGALLVIIETSNDPTPVTDRPLPGARTGGWTLAGRYRLDEPLGAGAMGEVWGGRDLWLHRTVAVKTLRGDAADHVSTALRFSREARAMARLNHPNVVTVHDFGEHEGEPYLVMERLPGRNLSDDLGSTPLDEATVCTVVRDVLAGLGAAHEAGLIHRDVKPGNILFAASGVAKLADFGIAKGAGQDLTRPGEFVGTWQYIAPELIAGQPATVQSDLYAIGVIMYFALSAKRPFAGDSLIELARSITQASPVPLATLRPDLDQALIAIVERAMHPSLEQRFADAASMIEALEAVEAVEGLGVVPGASPVGAVESHTDTDAAVDTESPDETAVNTEAVVDAVYSEEATAATKNRLIAGIGAFVLAIVITGIATGGDDAFTATRADDTFGTRTTIASPQAELGAALDRLEEAVAAAVTTAGPGTGTGTGTATATATATALDSMDVLADRVELVRQRVEDGNLEQALAELGELRVATVDLDDEGRLSEEHADAIRAQISMVETRIDRVVASSATVTPATTRPAIPVTVLDASPSTTIPTLAESATMAPPTTPADDDDDEEGKGDKGNQGRGDD